MAAPSQVPMRAPALYFAAVLPAEHGSVPFAFRLPCPPAWDDRAPSAWAAERRARRAYFATLDALRTGVVDEEQAAKARRLLHDLKSASARAVVTHFLRIFAMAGQAGGRAVVPTPPVPLGEVRITAPPMGLTTADELAARYRWALEWLEARRFVVGRGLRIHWQVRRMTLQGVEVVPVAPSPPSLRLERR